MPGRIVRSADFERILARPAVGRSAHFALHHAPADKLGQIELSTDDPEPCAQLVDESLLRIRTHHWLGLVVPKRFAREATTRNLIKRQAREVFRCRHAALACGMWLLRLRHGFDRRRFVSPTSAALRAAARLEIDGLLRRAGP